MRDRPTDALVADVRKAMADQVPGGYAAVYGKLDPAREALAELARRAEQADERESLYLTAREEALATYKDLLGVFAASVQRETTAWEALTEVHEYQCGCDRPGNISACIAQPVVVFAALAATEPAAADEETR